MGLKSASKVCIFVVVCLLFTACSSPSEATEAAVEPLVSEPDSANNTEPAPDFTLSTLDGEEVTLSNYEGEWVILNFWATWCPPCVSEMPYLQTLADRGLNVLGVNMAEEEGKVKLFTVKHGIKFPILMDPDDNIVLDYQARSLPRTVIIAPDGTIVLRIAGAVDGEQLDPWLDKHGVQ